ncbi:hypothetical protein [Lewinella sp. 4G2]|uniref:hypothetical protein n=1 Tax=Lewinella sp. 4G2 TaxID=1803372 RepID=UPI0007B4610A|nr:hypothetical protein [Lewinella sp. 4G2]OAV42829.1 hypothetical protein A3850_016495 [Lewinella sp. 4G2]
MVSAEVGPVTIPAEITTHRFGADFAFDSNSDTYDPSRFHGIEAAHFSAGLGFTLFSGKVNEPDVSQIEMGGRGEVQAYLLTDRWNQATTIPDYYKTVWTASGAEHFTNARVGATKPERYPNHGEEMYDVSGGLYGHKNGMAGTNRGEECYELIRNQEGRTTGTEIVAAYRNGKRGVTEMLRDGKSYLGSRNSRASISLDDLENDYDGQSRYDRPSTTRLFNDANPEKIWGTRNVNTNPALEARFQDAVLLTAEAGGFFSNFSHFHLIYNGIDQTVAYQQILQQVREAIDRDGYFVHANGYGAILQYLALRETTTVKAYREEDLIRIETTFSGADLPRFEDFDQPYVTVKISVPEWPGVRCDVCAGIRKEGTEYYVDVTPGRITLLQPDVDANYYNFTPPAVLRQTRRNGGIAVTTDRPTRVTVFRAPSDTPVFSTRLPPVRSAEVGTEHFFSASQLTEAGHDLYFGLMGEAGSSSLVKAEL